MLDGASVGKERGCRLWTVAAFPMPWCSKFHSKESRNSECRPSFPGYDIILNVRMKYLSRLDDKTYFI